MFLLSALSSKKNRKLQLPFLGFLLLFTTCCTNAENRNYYPQDYHSQEVQDTYPEQENYTSYYQDRQSNSQYKQHSNRKYARKQYPKRYRNTKRNMRKGHPQHLRQNRGKIRYKRNIVRKGHAPYVYRRVADEQEEQEEQGIISNFIEAFHKVIMLLYLSIKKVILGTHIISYVYKFIEIFIYAIITEALAYVIASPSAVWAYIATLAESDSGVLGQLFAPEIVKLFAWQALYGILIAILLTWLKTFIQSCIGDQRGKKTTLKRVIAIALRTLTIWLSISEPFGNNYDYIISCLGVLTIFTLAEFFLKDARKITSTSKKVIRGLVKGIFSYIAIMATSLLLAEFWFKRADKKIEVEQLSILNKSNGVTSKISFFKMLGVIVKNLFKENQNENTNKISYKDFVVKKLKEQNSNILDSEVELLVTGKNDKNGGKENQGGLMGQAKRYQKEKIKYIMSADGQPALIQFAFNIYETVKVTGTFINGKKAAKELVNNEENNITNGIRKLKETISYAMKMWNKFWEKLNCPKIKELIQILFFNCLLRPGIFIAK